LNLGGREAFGKHLGRSTCFLIGTYEEGNMSLETAENEGAGLCLVILWRFSIENLSVNEAF
jgi:hypothetical protein